MLEGRPVDAERTLIAARRYGNFPTLDHEIAAARMKSGFYRDAAEELSRSVEVSRNQELASRVAQLTRATGDLGRIAEMARVTDAAARYQDLARQVEAGRLTAEASPNN